MDALSSISCFSTCSKSPFPAFSPLPLFKRSPKAFSFLRATSQPVRELIEDDALKMFLRERQQNGDFVSKASDIFWLRDVMKLVDFDDGKLASVPQEVEQVTESDDGGGFLKLSATKEWLSGDYSAPMNKKAVAKAMQDDSDRRKKLNFLKYEALKRELMLLSIGIGAACSGYCLVVLSIQAAISYAIGALFRLVHELQDYLISYLLNVPDKLAIGFPNNMRHLSVYALLSSFDRGSMPLSKVCLYLQLLYKYADNLSKEMIPPIFLQKKSKKIGIRSGDISDSLMRSIKGSSIALSSPRLVIPAAIYGLWALSHHYFTDDIFDFQIVPAMLGMFVYKAAALVQVYRDNEDLVFIFPDSKGDSSD